MLKLRVMGDTTKDIWLVEPGVVIGSEPGCELHLNANGVQGRHAEVTVAPGDKLTLVNLAGSDLQVNNVNVTADQEINIGDEISIGAAKVMVVDPKDGFVANTTPAEPASPWSIKANHSALNNRVYPISTKTVLGRSNDCDITLSVTHLSRKHAELNVVANKLVVKDLDSANGTYVNGKKVKEETLRKGDELRLDTLSFTVMGPADDMDKTSVRAVINPATAAAATESREAVKSQAQKKATPTAPKQRVVTASKQPEAAASEAEEAGGNSGVIIAAVVAVVVIGGLAAYFLI